MIHVGPRRPQLAEAVAELPGVGFEAAQVEPRLGERRLRRLLRFFPLPHAELKRLPLGCRLGLPLGRLGRGLANGLHAGFAGDGQQQQHQRPHRADQHRQEGEQRHPKGAAAAMPALEQGDGLHAAWTARRPGSNWIEGFAEPTGVSDKRTLSRWMTAASSITVCSKCLAPAKVARLRFRASSKRVTSPLASTAR